MSKAAHHGRLLPTSVKVDFTPSKSRPAASRAQIADFRHQTKPESLTNWSLQGVPRDSFATDPVPSNYAHGARDRAAQAGPIIRLCARLIFAYCCQPRHLLRLDLPLGGAGEGFVTIYWTTCLQGTGHCGTAGYSPDKCRTNGVEPSGMGVAYHGERSVF